MSLHGTLASPVQASPTLRSKPACHPQLTPPALPPNPSPRLPAGHRAAAGAALGAPPHRRPPRHRAAVPVRGLGGGGGGGGRGGRGLECSDRHQGWLSGGRLLRGLWLLGLPARWLQVWVAVVVVGLLRWQSRLWHMAALAGVVGAVGTLARRCSAHANHWGLCSQAAGLLTHLHASRIARCAAPTAAMWR